MPLFLYTHVLRSGETYRFALLPLWPLFYVFTGFQKKMRTAPASDKRLCTASSTQCCAAGARQCAAASTT